MIRLDNVSFRAGRMGREAAAFRGRLGVGRVAPDTDGRALMDIFSSQVVAEASELPWPVLVLTALAGPVLWVLGWRIHRMLFVAASTVVGGLYGLTYGSAIGLYPAVAAALLSLSAAGLALALLRIGVFAVFGALADWAVSSVAVGQLNEQGRVWIRVAAFLAGGLFSLLCYRFLIIVITSFTGAFLLLLGGLAFVAQHGEADTVALAENRPGIVWAAFVLLGLLGTVGQYWVERFRRQHRIERSREPTNELIRRILKVKASD